MITIDRWICRIMGGCALACLLLIAGAQLAMREQRARIEAMLHEAEPTLGPNGLDCIEAYVAKNRALAAWEIQNAKRKEMCR